MTEEKQKTLGEFREDIESRLDRLAQHQNSIDRREDAQDAIETTDQYLEEIDFTQYLIRDIDWTLNAFEKDIKEMFLIFSNANTDKNEEIYMRLWDIDPSKLDESKVEEKALITRAKELYGELEDLLKEAKQLEEDLYDSPPDDFTATYEALSTNVTAEHGKIDTELQTLVSNYTKAPSPKAYDETHKALDALEQRHNAFLENHTYKSFLKINNVLASMAHREERTAAIEDAYKRYDEIRYKIDGYSYEIRRNSDTLSMPHGMGKYLREQQKQGVVLYPGVIEKVKSGPFAIGDPIREIDIVEIRDRIALAGALIQALQDPHAVNVSLQKDSWESPYDVLNKPIGRVMSTIENIPANKRPPALQQWFTLLRTIYFETDSRKRNQIMKKTFPNQNLN